MSVIAELQLAGDFALSELLRGLPDVRMQLERVIPAGDRTIPLIWIHTGDPEPAEQKLRAPTAHNTTRISAYPNSSSQGIVPGELLLVGLADCDGEVTAFDRRLRFEVI